MPFLALTKTERFGSTPLSSKGFSQDFTVQRMCRVLRWIAGNSTRGYLEMPRHRLRKIQRPRCQHHHPRSDKNGG